MASSTRTTLSASRPSLSTGSSLRMQSTKCWASTRTKFETYGEFVTLHFGDIHIPRIGNEEPLRVEAQHFVDCILNDEPVLSDGRDALNVVRVLDAMERSLRNGGQPVKTSDLT